MSLKPSPANCISSQRSCCLMCPGKAEKEEERKTDVARKKSRGREQEERKRGLVTEFWILTLNEHNFFVFLSLSLSLYTHTHKPFILLN